MNPHIHPSPKARKLLEIRARKDQAQAHLTENPTLSETERQPLLKTYSDILNEESALHAQPDTFECRGPCKKEYPLDQQVCIVFIKVIKKLKDGSWFPHFEAYNQIGRHQEWYLALCEDCFEKLALIEMPEIPA